MKILIAVLALPACGGAALIQCPSPFASMQTETTCFDARPALDIVWAAGLEIDPSTIHLTVMGYDTWDSPAGEAQGWTDEFNVYVSRNTWPLVHELLHVSEHPRMNVDHAGWDTNGFYALVNLDRYVQTGEAGAWGWKVKPCREPTMPAEMTDKLRTAGYPVDVARADAARVCE